jgi:hypothetical protein
VVLQLPMQYQMRHLARYVRGGCGTHRSAQIESYKENNMKKYVKPSLIGLGLLREVTKFSGCGIQTLVKSDICVS